MQKTIFALATLITFVALVSPVFALNITLSIDRRAVQPNESFTISGTIANDNGTTGVFTYRAAAVGPNRTFVCDSGKLQTGTDGKFSLTCIAPTREKAVEIGIPAAKTRNVIPLVAGVAVTDPVANKTIKKQKNVLVILKSDLTKKLNALISDLDSFVKIANNLSERCARIAAVAPEVAGVNITQKCLQITNKTQIQINDATRLKEKLQSVLQNASAENLEDLKKKVKESNSNVKTYRSEFTQEVKDVRDVASKIKTEVLTVVRGGKK